MKIEVSDEEIQLVMDKYFIPDKYREQFVHYACGDIINWLEDNARSYYFWLKRQGVVK